MGEAHDYRMRIIIKQTGAVFNRKSFPFDNFIVRPENRETVFAQMRVKSNDWQLGAKDQPQAQPNPSYYSEM
jgi:hypothetical protein